MQKKILHLTGMTSTKYGGLEHYFLELVSLCRQRGYHTVLQYEQLPQSPAYLAGLKRLGAEIITLNTRTRLDQSIRGITSLIRSVRPNILQTHFLTRKIHFVVPIIARALGVPKVIAMVHSMPDLKRNSRGRFAFNNYHHVLAVSDAVADNLIQGGVNPKVVSTHYLGLFGKREKSEQLRSRFRKEFGISEDAVIIACIAFDTPFKGLDVLLNVYAKIVQNYKQLHLIVVGVDPHQSSLPDQAAELGLSNSIHWAGIRDEGWQILNAADVYIQPSRFGEGLPLAVIEAMALKLPVIATRVAGVPEAVIDGETGYLSEPDSVESLATTIACLLPEQSKWKIMGEAGYHRYLRLFRGENSIKTLVENYFEL